MGGQKKKEKKKTPFCVDLKIYIILEVCRSTDWGTRQITAQKTHPKPHLGGFLASSFLRPDGSFRGLK